MKKSNQSKVTRHKSSTSSQVSAVSRKSTVSRSTLSKVKVADTSSVATSVQTQHTDVQEDRHKGSDEDKMMYDKIGKSLATKSYYHGFMPREDVEASMKAVGDFILRRSSVNGKSAFILSVKVMTASKDAKHMHIRIGFKNNAWSIAEDVTRANLTTLMTYYQSHPSTFSTAPGPLLKHGVPRPEFYILHENIDIGKEIGKGAFGTVHVGSLRRDNDKIDVAIKKMKNDKIAKKDLIEFFKECRLMLRFNHANVVKIYGVAPGDTPVLIALELASGGSLKSYCKKNDPSVEQMTNFAKDACKGMHYLQCEKVIHRDLAARNCLLGPKNEVKISDFGLSHMGTTLELTKMTNVPIKWLSPETLTKGRFSHKSDVWSYGVLLWEIFTKCATDPFPGMTNKEARVNILEKRPPMDPIPCMPDVVKETMAICFTFDEEDRPDFTGVMRKLIPDAKFVLSEYISKV